MCRPHRRLLAPGGRLVLVEGRWHTGAGLAGERVVQACAPHVNRVETRTLDDADLWGGTLTDDRYVVLAYA